MIKERSIVNKVLIFYNKDYQDCLKISQNIQPKSLKIISFKKKLGITMPFYLKNAEDLLTESIKSAKTVIEKDVLKEELSFFAKYENLSNNVFWL